MPLHDMPPCLQGRQDTLSPYAPLGLLKRESSTEIAQGRERATVYLSGSRLGNEPEWGLRTGVPHISPESPFVSLANNVSVPEKGEGMEVPMQRNVLSSE